MPIASYIENISKRYALGNATEHTFRGDLQQLIEELAPGIAATNEPKRIDCGAPDYVLTRNKIPVGYIEAKDVNTDLDGKNLQEQFDRYRHALDNLAFTDYLDFRFFVNGELTSSVRIAEVAKGKIISRPENFDHFADLLTEFASRTPVTVKSSKKLAEMMADKAKILAYIIRNAVESDIASGVESDLTNQLKAFKDILIHDIDAKAFADIYAQTIAYGMFAARLHDKELDTFSRQEAAEKIPKTNPFLRKLFQFIAAYDLDTRIDWIVDALADLFRATDIAAILKNFGKSTQTHDPIIHFYETFLAEYDPKLRKSRGVFYTPEPVVDFIVRAVDDILKSEFNLSQGLADTSKTKITLKSTVKDDRTKSGYREEEKEVHKVQILDPATGTGTFLATVIKQIYKRFEGQEGVWNQYVDEHLIPRLNGFELLMASYAMAHLKLDLLLTELSGTAEPFAERKSSAFPADASLSSGGSAAERRHSLEDGKEHDGEAELRRSATRQAAEDRSERFQVYLTNALEEYHPDTGTLFASWLSTEANEANHIKRDTPVMVVIGNPPYSVSSSNRSVDSDGKMTWIGNLIDDYKRDLNERKINLDDDYIKFIRFGQHFVEKNGFGILAFITNNSFLDGLTHRKMRSELLRAFDLGYIVNLHGNSNLKETAPNGGKDENVFDIRQGVSINIFVKNGSSRRSGSAIIQYEDIFGLRKHKYDFLSNNDLNTVKWLRLDCDEPFYFFSPKDFNLKEEYENGLSITSLMINNNTGIQTKCDELSIQFDQASLEEVVKDFKGLTVPELKQKYPNKNDSSGWNFSDASADLRSNEISYTEILYRPFDIRHTLYTGKGSGFIGRPRTSTMRHLVDKQNVGLITLRINGENEEFVCLLTKTIVEKGSLPRGNYSVFPLYLYPDGNQRTLDGRTERVPNLNSEIVKKIAAATGLTFVAEKGEVLAVQPQSSAVGLARPDDDQNDSTRSKAEPPSEQGIGGKPDGQASLTALQSGKPQDIVGTFAPIDILDYIYAVLHSPSYREKYKEFLKIDFPRVPYPRDPATFWQLVALGGELREIHLLESPRVSEFITGFPAGGDNVVEKPEYKNGSVYFNNTQYFENVPQIAWNFYIGGYQPAQKWLKDRKGRTLSFDDINHYQKIIVALTETDRLMKEIDKIDIADDDE